MKGIIIICDQELEREMDFIFRTNHIDSYSLFKNVMGKGESGLKMGDSIGPGLNFAYWIVLDDKWVPSFIKDLKEFKENKLKNKGISVFTFPIEGAF